MILGTIKLKKINGGWNRNKYFYLENLTNNFK